MSQNSQKSNNKGYLKHVVLSVVVYGILTGTVVGSIVFFFNRGASWCYAQSKEIYSYISTNPIWIPVLLLALVLLATISYFVHKWAPESRGGGISLAEGIIKGLLTFKWLRMAIGVVINSFISFFAGLPMGQEGPSVALGTATSAGLSESKICHNSWNRYVLTAGACSGFTVALNAPLTGVMFALEEAHKKFSPTIILMAFSACVSANISLNLWSAVFNLPVESLFHLGKLQAMDISQIWAVALLGIGVGLAVCAFNWLAESWHNLFQHKLKNKLHPLLRNIIMFVVLGSICIGLFALTEGQIHGGGHHLIIDLVANKIPWHLVLLLLLIKIVTIPMATSSGVTGGIFVPILAIGALVGATMGNICVGMGLDIALYGTIVVIGMTAFLGGSMRAPITAILFMLEGTWQFENLLFVCIAMFFAVLIPQLIRQEPIYDVMLENLEENQNHGKERKIVLLKCIVDNNSFACGKQFRDILWPANTIIREIYNSEGHIYMDHDGEKFVNDGNTILLQVETYNLDKTITDLKDIVGNNCDIVQKQAE